MKTVRSLLALVLTIALLSAAALWQRAGTEPAAEIVPPLRDQALRYWKGNLHTHSLWSDGDDYPEMIADWYKSHGYHFLAMTDHNRLSEGERWVDSTGEKSKAGGIALEKYLARVGPSWVERRELLGKWQVRLKP